MFNLEKLIRPNILELKPYASARDEFSGSASIFLDANENPFNEPYNRYPDPYQTTLKHKISEIKNVPAENIFLGNGSDEPIDLLFRIFCNPGVDNVISISPSYGMYGVSAGINDIELRNVLLTPNFQLDADAVLNAADENSKIVWLCSPNNPTGNLLKKEDILKVVNGFNGLVVVDEAYIDFCAEATLLDEFLNYPNLIVLQTFSKAWGMAGIRLGMAFCSTQIIGYFNKVKYPYNLNILTQQKATELLNNKEGFERWRNEILSERIRMLEALASMENVEQIHPTDANFILIRMQNANGVYNNLVEKGVIIRDRSKVALCKNCLRITVGTKQENNVLLEELKKI